MATSLTYQDGSSAPFQLKITSNEDKQQFMKAIHADFLEKVDAVETGLIDSLISCGVLTDSDTESLDGRDVRTTRDKARRLHLILEKLPVGVFVSRAGPVLCSKFDYIIPLNFRTAVGELAGAMETDEKERDNYCLRCSISRCIRVSTMADLLFRDGRLEPLDYKAITANCYEDHWEKIFQAFKNPKMEVTEKLTNGIREVLQRHFIAIPVNLPVSLEHGLPCECSNIPHSQKNFLSTIKVLAWQQMDESAPSVSVTLGNLLSDQTPLRLLSDDEEADDEDSSTHYPGSEETFSSRDKDFENESLLSSSEVFKELPKQVCFYPYTGALSKQTTGYIKEDNFSHYGADIRPVHNSCNMSVVIFYHYTSHCGKEAIKSFGNIRAGSFTHFGTGVYGTTMPPSAGKEAIARNNWTVGWYSRLSHGRADYAILVRLPADMVQECNAGGRNLYKYTGGEQLTLSNYDWEVVVVP